MDEQDLLPIEETSLDEDQEITPDTSEKELQYRVLNIYNEIVNNPDLERGFLTEERVTIHHPRVPAQGHYKVTSVQLSDGTVFYPTEDDPRIDLPNPQDHHWRYVPQDEESANLVVVSSCINWIVDVPEIPSYDSEEIIYRYRLYTDKQLNNNIFLNEAPERLETVENDSIDLLETVAELAGSDIEDRVLEAQETIDDLLLIIADLVGGAEE